MNNLNYSQCHMQSRLIGLSFYNLRLFMIYYDLLDENKACTYLKKELPIYPINLTVTRTSAGLFSTP